MISLSTQLLSHRHTSQGLPREILLTVVLRPFGCQGGRSRSHGMFIPILCRRRYSYKNTVLHVYQCI